MLLTTVVDGAAFDKGETFSGVDFNKGIKTVKLRNQEIKTGMIAYKLNGKMFDVSIGNRVLQTEIIEDGAYPVYSANVFEEFGRINKQNLTDFSVPSIIWGIDGDWMVNCLPANMPFYPTDHCGVLRVKTDDIIPQYLAMALEAEGKNEKFSRSNRASAQRIKALTIQIPVKDIQQQIVDEFAAIDQEIAVQESIITDCNDKAQAKFAEMFGNIANNPFGFQEKEFGKCCILNPTKPNNIRDSTEVSFIPMSAVSETGNVDNSIHKQYLEVATGYTFFADDDVLFAKITPCMENGKGGIARNLLGGIGFGSTEFHVLRPQKEISSSYWLYYVTKQTIFRENAANAMTGTSGHRRVPESFISKCIVPYPPFALQQQFADYVQTLEQEKAAATEKRDELKKSRAAIVKKYFE